MVAVAIGDRRAFRSRKAVPQNEEAGRSFRKLVALYVALVVAVCIVPAVSHASDLTDLFTTVAFSGSWEVFAKFNWLGKALQFLISTFCLLGIVLTVVRVTITILYKSSESIFDRVHEIHTRAQGNQFFGLPTAIKEVAGGNFGTGADAIIGFLFFLMPDIVVYSDYNPDRMAYNLQKDDTLTTYFLKISLPTIFTIFFFAIGFNGVLWQAYGNVVDALATVAKKAVDVDLAAYVNKALNAGAYYQFSLDDGTEVGAFKEKIAKSLYNRMLLKMDDLSTSQMQTVGSSIQSWVDKQVTAGDIDSHLNVDASSRKVAEDDSAVKNFTYNVEINSNSTAPEGKGVYHRVVPIGDLGVSVSGDVNYYVHLIISKNPNADETRYFELGGGTTSKGDAGTVDKPLGDKK
ncbi:MAG: hypothetical protein K1W15_01795 [Lachnospiraceae bacterium]